MVGLSSAVNYYDLLSVSFLFEFLAGVRGDSEGGINVGQSCMVFGSKFRGRHLNFYTGSELKKFCDIDRVTTHLWCDEHAHGSVHWGEC